ncbi:LuxR C-terminal-related transcriptional regulator [Cryobacterium arcticum]|uniref:LuxR family transcriptional regulator n=1 Tax=Cryobacterium arcticum TaxID=670052 RepID=A0A1B1BK89_9MICO|nr:LuxR C-terminal-related transcriptional regulator [Cryobacterium arcticum]ANP72853.1 LuxR family transcriptional regulator [Cryobacterium arcticum]
MDPAPTPLPREPWGPPGLASEPEWYLHRSRLDDLVIRLQGTDARVLQLWDAAGSGKTTLLAGWARRLAAEGAEVRWMTGPDLVTARDPDAVWRLFAETRDLQALRGRPPDVPQTHTALRYVFIDDVDLPAGPGETGPAIPDGWWPMISLAPPELRIIVAGRRRPGTGTAPLLAAGVLLDCPEDMLAFTLDETLELAGRRHLRVSPEDAAVLWRNTGGWATALTFALAGQGQDREHTDPSPAGDSGIAASGITHTEVGPAGSTLTDVDGATPAIADYVATEVLDGLDDDERDILMRSAVSFVVPLDLAVRVTARSDAGDVLERVSRNNGMLVRVPDVSHRSGAGRSGAGGSGRTGTGSVDSSAETSVAAGEAYRFHPILLSYLQAAARGHDADATNDRHVLACHWFSDRSEGAAALDQALQARDAALVGEVLDRFGLTLVLSGDTDLVGRALRRLDTPVPSTAALALRVLLDAPAFAARRRAHQLLAAAGDTAGGSGLSPQRRPGLWPAVIEILHALLAVEPADVAKRLQALQGHRVGEAARLDLAIDLLTGMAEGRCLDRLGLPGPAEDILRDVAEAARMADYSWLFLVASDLAATAAAHAGRWLQVAMLESQMAESPAPPSAADQVSSRAVLYTMIRRYERCQPLDVDAVERLSAHPHLAYDAGLSVPAQVLLLLNGFDTDPHSRRTMDTLMLLMREVGSDHPRSLSLCCVPLLEVSGALDGRPETQAVVRLVESVLGEESLEALLLRFLSVPPTRAGHPAEERLREAALDERTAWRGSTIVSAWIALAHVAELSGRHVESDARLLRALRLASQFGTERAFLAVGGQGTALIRSRLGRLGDLDEFARHILRCAARVRPSPRGPGTEAGRSSPQLTQREREVLRELPVHQSVADIARKRNVSPNTVKTHLRNIYQKLEAANRADAVAIAQERGLL